MLIPGWCGCRFQEAIEMSPQLFLGRGLPTGGLILGRPALGPPLHWGFTWSKGANVPLPWGSSGICPGAHRIQQQPFWLHCSFGHWGSIGFGCKFLVHMWQKHVLCLCQLAAFFLNPKSYKVWLFKSMLLQSIAQSLEMWNIECIKKNVC